MYTLAYVSDLISTLMHFACLVSAIPLSYTQSPTPSKVGSYCMPSHREDCVYTQADVPILQGTQGHCPSCWDPDGSQHLLLSSSWPLFPAPFRTQPMPALDDTE